MALFHFNSRTATEITDIAQVKGLDDNVADAINYDSLRGTFEYLASNSERKLSTICGSLLSTFEKTKRQMELLSGMPAYSTVVDMIKEKFNGKRVSPETVGAYFIGCLNTSQMPQDFPRECSSTCVGSISGRGKTKCSERVILAKFSSGKYRFTDANGYNGNINAIVFVPAIPTFSGFTKDERASLREMGVTKGKVYTQDLSGEVDEVGTVGDARNVKVEVSTPMRMSTFFALALLFLLLFAIVFYYFYKSKRESVKAK